MFSMFIVCYLFLAGAGSGAYTIAAVFSILGRYIARDDLREYRIITRGGFWLGPLLVGFGVVFLILDLGFPERAFSIFLSPRLSILGVGSWAILLFYLFSFLSLFFHNSSRFKVAKAVLRIVDTLALLCAVAVMVYTGVFVSSIKAVRFLYSVFTPILFVVSSLSSGAAVITLYGFFNQHKKSMHYGLRIISFIDALLIFFEVLALLLLFIQKYLESGLARESLMNILFGEGLAVFWFGVIIIGVLLPLALGLIARSTPQPVSAVTWALSSVGILVGAFALRCCLICFSLNVQIASIM